MIVANATSMCVPIVIILSKWQDEGGQIGRGDKAYSPVIARYEAIPNFTDGYVPLQSSRLLRRSSSQ
jgi:hypothetical protein